MHVSVEWEDFHTGPDELRHDRSRQWVLNALLGVVTRHFRPQRAADNLASTTRLARFPAGDLTGTRYLAEACTTEEEREPIGKASPLSCRTGVTCQT